ncbi:MAG: hypothetical protein WD316_08225 [Phycisphaeraceae bacterium]
MAEASAELKRKLNEAFERMTPEQQRRAVELVTHLRDAGRSTAADHLRTERWAGCLEHVDMSAMELQNEASRLRRGQVMNGGDDLPR